MNLEAVAAMVAALDEGSLDAGSEVFKSLKPFERRQLSRELLLLAGVFRPEWGLLLNQAVREDIEQEEKRVKSSNEPSTSL